MIIHATLTESGQVIPQTDDDRRRLELMFPDGNVRLNSDNCPELAAEIKRLSGMLLRQNRATYEALAKYD